jgi:hypothetical protein
MQLLMPGFCGGGLTVTEVQHKEHGATEYLPQEETGLKPKKRGAVMISRIETADISSTEELGKKANKALVLNIIFFVVLFLGMLSLPFVGFYTSALIVSLIFVLTIVYIYLT